MVWVFRIFIIAVIVLGGGYVFLMFSNSSSCQKVDDIGTNPPSIIDAPDYVQTLSRVYYTKDYDLIKDGNGEIEKIIMYGYYETVDDKWVYRVSTLPIDREHFGVLKVGRRSPPGE